MTRREKLAKDRESAVLALLSTIAPKTVRQLCMGVHGTQFEDDRHVMDLILYDLNDRGIAVRVGPLGANGWDDRWISQRGEGA